MNEAKADPNELTNFERLAKALPATGIAQALLSAWSIGDPSSRVARLINVAQPQHPKDDNNNDSPKD